MVSILHLITPCRHTRRQALQSPTRQNPPHSLARLSAPLSLAQPAVECGKRSLVPHARDNAPHHHTTHLRLGGMLVPAVPRSVEEAVSQTEDRFAQALSARRPTPAPGLPLQEAPQHVLLKRSGRDPGNSPVALRPYAGPQQGLAPGDLQSGRLLRQPTPLAECRPRADAIHT